MTKYIKLFIVMGIVGLVSACSSTFKSDVSRFHELPKPQGESVMIVPSDPAKVASLEFASYANIVGSYLAQQGYVPAGDGKADLIVELDYSVDDGKVFVRSSPSAFSFGYGYGYGYFGHHYYYSRWYRPLWYYGYYPYSYYGYGDRFNSDVRSYVKYTRRLNMTIRPNVDGAKNLFEGKVESTGRSNKLTALMPHMVQALFTSFPGVSGTTVKVVIDLDKD